MPQRVVDYIDVPVFHIIAIMVTFTDVEAYLKIVSLLLAIGYTTWKWTHEYKKRK